MVDISPELDDLGWCPFARLSGQPCVLCGGTRAVVWIARGNIPEALKFNSIVVIAVLIGLGSALYAIILERSFIGSVKRVQAWYRQMTAIPIAGQLLIFAGWWMWNIGRW